MNNIQSVLKLNELVFDKIKFNRLGFKTDNELDLNFQSNISQRKDGEIYKVTLIVNGNKKDEYLFEISLSGYFTIEGEDINEKVKNDLITKNTIAILMPYIRSEISLLTAQPGTESVVLPAFNINKLLEDR